MTRPTDPDPALRERAERAEAALAREQAGAAAMRAKLLDLARFLREWHQRDFAQAYDARHHCNEIVAVLAADAGAALLAERDRLAARVAELEAQLAAGAAGAPAPTEDPR